MGEEEISVQVKKRKEQRKQRTYTPGTKTS